MKILHVVSGVYRLSGGTSEVVPRMGEALKDAGHEVRVLTLDWGPISEAAERAESKGVEIEQCVRDEVLVAQGLGLSRDFTRRIVAAVAWADVVHLHGLWQWPCWRAADEARRQHKPYVLQTHGFLEPERLKKSRLKKRIIGAFIERPRINRAARIIATAESEKLGIIAWGVRPPVEIVPIGLDTAAIDGAKKDRDLLASLVGTSLGKKRILLYFSRLAPIKGLDMLAEAWAQLKECHDDWHLLIVGPDDRGYAEEVRHLFGKLCPQGTWTIHEPVFGADKFTLLKSVDAFVLPTRSENFSIAVQEALAAGVPVVCTKGAPWSGVEGSVVMSGQTSESNVGWGRCGYWVEVGVDGIAQGLRKLLGAADEERRVMGLEGTKFISSEFSWERIAERLTAIYRGVKVGHE